MFLIWVNVYDMLKPDHKKLTDDQLYQACHNVYQNIPNLQVRP